MSKKRRGAAEYSPEEFDAVVALIQSDAGLRADIEAITGQTLDGKTPRELFEAFRAIDAAADIQISVARYGKARQLVRETRAELAAAAVEDLSNNPDIHQLARTRIGQLETTVDEQRALIERLRTTNKGLMSGAAPVPGLTQGQVSA